MDLREIASRAGVSSATVSRALNGNPSVHPRLARRVWKVVNEVGYYPNRHARSLVTGRSLLLGLVVSEITNPFFPEIVQTFEDLAVKNNYEILLSSTAHDPKRIESSLRRMIERRVDGVAILTFGLEETLLNDLLFREVPLVFVDVGANTPGVVSIGVDYAKGIRQAVQHLAALHHTRIAFITGPPSLKTAMARQEAFQISMGEIGLDPGLIIRGNHSMEGGVRALQQIESWNIRPTAVICSNDLTAMGVMLGAFDQDIRVPSDLSVIGFDNIRLAEFSIPPLTTVEMSQAELARIAFEALLVKVGRGSVSNGRSEYVLTTNLVLRHSTALIAAGSG
jgi:DNA-binding LacI/PurR family transcriptional regulator